MSGTVLIVGAGDYIGAAIAAVILSPVRDERSLVLLALVIIWAARLGTFLFRRIRRERLPGMERHCECQQDEREYQSVHNLCYPTFFPEGRTHQLSGLTGLAPLRMAK